MNLRMRIRQLFGAFVILGIVGVPLSGGDLKGRIITQKKIHRKVPLRYPGAHAQRAQKFPKMPAVIFLIGKIKGFPPPSQKAPYEIKQENFQFVPPLLIVPIGANVAFPNLDRDFHNVFSYSKIKRFDLGRYHKGESKTVTFQNAGVGKIYCEIHEWMRAAIVVIENPFYAIANEEGLYEIKNIPEGEYDFYIWKIDHKKRIQTISIPKEGVIVKNVALPQKKERKND